MEGLTKQREGSGLLRILKSRWNLLFVVAFVLGVLALISFGGWHQLAKKYPHQPPAGTKTFRFVSMGTDRGASYEFVLTVQADPHYIHLSTPFFYFPFHPPLSIPWSAVTECKWDGSALGIYLSEPKIGLRFGGGELGSYLHDLCVSRR